jgi:hypothetical protein
MDAISAHGPQMGASVLVSSSSSFRQGTHDSQPQGEGVTVGGHSKAQLTASYALPTTILALLDREYASLLAMFSSANSAALTVGLQIGLASPPSATTPSSAPNPGAPSATPTPTHSTGPSTPASQTGSPTPGTPARQVTPGTPARQVTPGTPRRPSNSTSLLAIDDGRSSNSKTRFTSLVTTLAAESTLPFTGENILVVILVGLLLTGGGLALATTLGTPRRRAGSGPAS